MRRNIKKEIFQDNFIKRWCCSSHNHPEGWHWYKKKNRKKFRQKLKKELDKETKEWYNNLNKKQKEETKMTTLTYVCTTKDGKVVEVKTYDEALKIKAEGGTYKPKYTEVKTY